MNTLTRHAMHHARYVKNYGLITSTPDRLFDTIWEDYDIVGSFRKATNQIVGKAFAEEKYIQERHSAA